MGDVKFDGVQAVTIVELVLRFARWHVSEILTRVC